MAHRHRNTYVLSEWTKQDEKLLKHVRKNHVVRVQSIVNKSDSIDPSKVNSDTGLTALHAAAAAGFLDITKLLMQTKSININARDIQGRTAVHLAVQGAHYDVVSHIIEKAEPNLMLVDHNGMSVLHSACVGGHLGCVQLLLNKYAPVYVKEKNGRSALSFAAERGQASICRLLLEHGADVNDKDNSNRTCLMVAAEYGQTAVCDYLLRKGADLTRIDARGRDAIFIAKKNQHKDVVKLLEKVRQERLTDVQLQTDSTSGSEELRPKAEGGEEPCYEDLTNAVVEPPASGHGSEHGSAVNGSGSVAAASIKSRERAPTPVEQLQVTEQYEEESAVEKHSRLDDEEHDEEHTYNEPEDSMRFQLENHSSTAGSIDGRVMVDDGEGGAARDVRVDEGIELRTSDEEDVHPPGTQISADRPWPVTSRGQMESNSAAAAAAEVTSSLAGDTVAVGEFDVVDDGRRDSQPENVSTSSDTIVDHTVTLNTAASGKVSNHSTGIMKSTLLMGDGDERAGIPGEQEVELDVKDVDLLRQIIVELEADKIGLQKQVEETRAENNAMEKKSSLVINSHQWLLQELEQILHLVESFRCTLSASRLTVATTASTADATDEQRSGTEREDVVDSGLQQIEKLLLALLRLDPDEITDGDLYGCPDTDHERLVSTAARLLRNNRTLQFQLEESIKQINELEQVVAAAIGLKDEHDVISEELRRAQGELGAVRAAVESLDPHVVTLQRIRTEDLSTVLSRVGEEIIELRKEKKQPRACQVERTQVTEAEMEKLHEENERLQKMLHELKNEIEKKNEDRQQKDAEENSWLETLAVKDRALQEMADVYERSVSEAREELENMKEEYSSVKYINTDLEERVQQLEAAEKSYQNEFEIVMKEMTAENEKLSQLNAELRRKIEELEKRAADAKTSERETAAATAGKARPEMKFLALENRKLQDENERLNEAVMRQSEMILEMDEKLRESQQTAAHAHHERLRKDSASSGMMTISGEDDVMRRELEETAEKLRAGEVEKRQLTADLEKARMESRRLERIVAQLKAELVEKDTEVEVLREKLDELENQLESERKEFSFAVDLVKKDNERECARLGEENAKLRNLIRKLENSASQLTRNMETLATSQPLLQTSAVAGDEMGSQRKTVNTEAAVIGKQQKCFEVSSTHHAQSEFADKMETGNKQDTANTADGTDYDETDGQGTTDETRLTAELTKAVVLSRRILDENRRLRQEFDETKAAESRASSSRLELENMELKSYIGELESEAEALRRTVNEQSVYLDYPSDGKIDESASKSIRKTGTEKDARPHGEFSDFDELDGQEFKIADRKPQRRNYVEIIASPDDAVAGGMKDVECDGKFGNHCTHSESESHHLADRMEAGKDGRRYTPTGLAAVDKAEVRLTYEQDVEGRTDGEISELRQKLETLTEQMSSVREELASKQMKVGALEELLAAYSVEIKQHRGFHQLVEKFVNQLERASTGETAGFQVDEWQRDQLEMAMDGKDAETVQRLVELVEDCLRSADEKNTELEQKVAAVEKANQKFEAAARRDGELVKSLTETLEKLRTEARENEAAKHEAAAAAASCKSRSSDVDSHNGKQASQMKFLQYQDVLDSLRLENDHLRQLLESRSADYEEEMMAEIEKLKAECIELKEQLLAARTDAESLRNSQEKTRRSSKVEVLLVKQPEVAVDDKELAEVRRELDRERQTSDRLRQEVSRLVEEVESKSGESRKLREAHCELREANASLQAQNSRLLDGEAELTRSLEKLKAVVDVDTETAETQTEDVHDEDEDDGNVDSDAVSSEGDSPVCRPCVPVNQSSLHHHVAPTANNEYDENIGEQNYLGSNSNSSAVDVAELVRRYGKLIDENRSLRDRMAVTWKVSVQHAVRHSVGVQTHGAVVVAAAGASRSVSGQPGEEDGRRRWSSGRRLERELCRLLSRGRALLAELFYLQCKAVDRFTETTSDDELVRKLLRDVTVESLRRANSATRLDERLCDAVQLDVEDADDQTSKFIIQSRSGRGSNGTNDNPDDVEELARSVLDENERLTDKISTLRLAVESRLSIQQQLAVTVLSGEDAVDADSTDPAMTSSVNHVDLNKLDASQLLEQISRLQKRIVESERRGREIIYTYRRHLLSSIQGRIDPLVKNALLHILEEHKQPRNNNNNNSHANDFSRFDGQLR